MNDYQKIATIFIRIMALLAMFYAIIDIGILATGILLISMEVIPREAFAHEIYFLQIVFYLMGGIILFARSKSLANAIIASFQDDDKPADEEADDEPVE